MTRWVVSLFLVLNAAAVDAATYYVGTSGNDANAGTSGSRWRNPQKCAQPPVAAGDTCLVGDGTYTAAEAGSTAFVILIASSVSSASGTAQNPITIKSENDHGAKLVQPTRNGAAVAVYVSRSHYIIEGFEVDGTGVTYNTGTSASHAGIGAYASDVTIRKNHIHHIARTQCSNSAFGNAGVFMNTGLSNIVIEKNVIHTIGRLRNGESSCVTDKFQHDHGIYITWGTNLTVQRNVIYDANRGYCMNIYSASTSVHTNYKIYNNVCAGRSPTGAPSGHIIIGGTWTNGAIRNNIFYQPDADLIIQRFNLSASSSGNTVSHNRTNLDLPGADFLFGASTPTGFTSTNNTENAAIGLANALCTQSDGGCENTDFTLASGSAAINGGTDVGLAYNGAAPDQGAFETFVFASCEVPSGAGTKIRVTYTNNANPPLRPSTSITTYTARRNTTNNVLNGAVVRVGDNITEITVTTTYVGGDVADISWASGNITDSSLIGGTLNQPLVQTLSNQSCVNNAGGASYTFSQASYEFRSSDGSEANPIILPLGYATTGAAENYASLESFAGGHHRIRFAVTCGGANCPDFGFYLYKSRNAGAYSLLTDTFDADNVAFCGVRQNQINPANGVATTNQLSTSGTFTPGGIVFMANAIPTITGLNNGFKTELEYCVRYDTDASGTFEYRLYRQDGVALDVYTVTPSVTLISPASGGAGF